jgi:glycosyltransferase involved in cell wall biosynthesis
VRVVIDYRAALREPSGVGQYTHQLVTALLKRFPPGDPAGLLELAVFSSSWKDRLVPTPDLTGATTIDRRLPVRALNLSWHRLGWPPIETLSGLAVDVTHSQSPLILPARNAAQIVSIHDLNFLTHPERTRAEIRRDYVTLTREHAHRADCILVPSEFTAREVVERLGVTREQVAICPPGAPDWDPRPETPTDGYVLFFGTLEPRKNVGALLDAWEQLIGRSSATAARAASQGPVEAGRRRKLPELVLAGKATDEAASWLGRIERPPLKGAVRHIGYVAPANRRVLYQGARLLVQPSFEEGFGLPVLEAMTFGLPVVASNRGALPEVVGDAGLLVDPERPSDLADAIERVLADEAFAAACATRGVSRARQFSWTRTAERVYEMYRQAVNHRARIGAASGSTCVSA